jgi:hypothetical protein
VPNLLALLRWMGEQDDADHHRRLLHYMFGTQAYDGDFHYSGYTDVLLCDELFRAGFGGVRMREFDGWMWEVDAVAGARCVGVAQGDGEATLHAAEPATVRLRVDGQPRSLDLPAGVTRVPGEVELLTDR